MALIKLGSLITHASGSLGGQTISKRKAGYVLHLKCNPHVIPTSAQYSIRSINPQLQAGWRALTDSKRLVWNSYAKTKPVFNKNGEKHPLSGHSLWMKYQYFRLIEQLPFLTDPSQYLDNYLGPELIVNGTFDTSDGWSLNPESSIHDGALYLLSTTVGAKFSYTSCKWDNLGAIYRVQFLSSNISGFIRFGCGYITWIPLQNGFYTYFYTLPQVYFKFYFYIFGIGSAIIDDLSVKLILT